SFVYAVNPTAKGTALEFAKDFDLSKIAIGDQVFLNKDPALEKELAKSFSDKELLKRIPIAIKAHLKLGCPIELVVSDQEHTFQIKSENILEMAKQQGASAQEIEKVLGALSGSPF